MKNLDFSKFDLKVNRLLLNSTSLEYILEYIFDKAKYLGPNLNINTLFLADFLKNINLTSIFMYFQ